MFYLIIAIFVLGYTVIALEHPLKVDKAATALITGTLCWVVYILGANEILNLGYNPGWLEFKARFPELHGIEAYSKFISETEIISHLGEIAEILFFLLGAMTIVEIVDQHEGFKVITDRVKTNNKVKLLWIISFLTFFLSALLDNLTTTIVLIALLRKLIDDKGTRWFFASMVVLAANAGGAWSPIGDVTTIMLWIGGQVTTLAIIKGVFIPSLLCMVVPLSILSFTMKGTVARPKTKYIENELTTQRQRSLFLILGVGGLLFVPVFKNITHLPPYMGMLLSLGVIWVVGEIIHRNKPVDIKNKLKVVNILRRVDTPTVLFFLGILSAVAALQSAGHLFMLANFLDEKLGNIYLINISIGFLSSVVDNVPLVAGAMGMYPIKATGAVGYDAFFTQDGLFWEFLAYTAGTGGSILIIGSAAGVAAMGLEKIDFIWYLKRISLLAVSGYLAGALAYYLMNGFS
jgi:Na+/H+ antiporter NhaD/arsenite permease-like protein